MCPGDLFANTQLGRAPDLCKRVCVSARAYCSGLLWGTLSQLAASFKTQSCTETTASRTTPTTRIRATSLSLCFTRHTQNKDVILNDRKANNKLLPNFCPFKITPFNFFSSTQYGMYTAHCGLEEVFMSWGHDGTGNELFNTGLPASAAPDLRAVVRRISLQSDEVQQLLHPR